MALPTQHPSSATHRPPRRVDLGSLLDTLLICSVITILVVRTCSGAVS
jgi:hypothetical protein